MSDDWFASFAAFIADVGPRGSYPQSAGDPLATATGSYIATAGLKTRLGITDSTDDTLLGTICDQVNQFIESKTGRILAAITLTAATFDGNDAVEEGRCLPFPQGIRSISLLEVAPNTGGTFTTVASGDFFLRPVSTKRSPGWPATEIWISDVPSSSTTYPYFPPGYDNVRITGTAGWAAVPDDVVAVAYSLGTAAWRARGAGGGDSFTIGTDGSRTFERMLSEKDRRTLEKYMLREVLIV